jgi:hypothetical protein
MPSPDPDAENRRRQHLSNPFWVLELAVEATPMEAERQGAKILAMLAAALPGAERYGTPLGDGARTPEAVRQALAEIRDPDRRVRHEWWAKGLGGP